MTDHFDKQARTWDQDPMKIERARITAEYCKKAPLRSTRKLLDFGGGTGLLSLALHDSFDHITIADASSEMLKVARQKIKTAAISNIDITKIETDLSEINDTYSAIITLMTLHHLPKPDVFFHQASKLLEDEGALMIADLYKEDGSFHKNIPGFDGHDGFEIESLSEALNDAGFSVSRVSEYYEIKKEVLPGNVKIFPLFFLVARKR